MTVHSCVCAFPAHPPLRSAGDALGIAGAAASDCVSGPKCLSSSVLVQQTLRLARICRGACVCVCVFAVTAGVRVQCGHDNLIILHIRSGGACVLPSSDAAGSTRRAPGETEKCTHTHSHKVRRVGGWIYAGRVLTLREPGCLARALAGACLSMFCPVRVSPA